MTLGAVREPRRGARHGDLAGRRKRELRDVRHSQRPDLRIERVLVSPSGIHVVASLHLRPGAADGPAVSPGDLERAHAAAGVVASLLPQRYRERVRPVLCRVDDVAMAELVDDVLDDAFPGSEQRPPLPGGLRRADHDDPVAGRERWHLGLLLERALARVEVDDALRQAHAEGRIELATGDVRTVSRPDRFSLVVLAGGARFIDWNEIRVSSVREITFPL